MKCLHFEEPSPSLSLKLCDAEDQEGRQLHLMNFFPDNMSGMLVLMRHGHRLRPQQDSERKAPRPSSASLQQLEPIPSRSVESTSGNKNNLRWLCFHFSQLAFASGSSDSVSQLVNAETIACDQTLQHDSNLPTKHVPNTYHKRRFPPAWLNMDVNT